MATLVELIMGVYNAGLVLLVFFVAAPLILRIGIGGAVQRERALIALEADGPAHGAHLAHLQLAKHRDRNIGSLAKEFRYGLLNPVFWVRWIRRDQILLRAYRELAALDPNVRRYISHEWIK